MVRPMQMQDSDKRSDGSVPLAIGLFVSVSAVVTLCAKHARRVSRNYTINNNNMCSEKTSADQKIVVSKSRLNKFISSLSNKANPKKGDDDELEEPGFGEGGLWQKDILMGEKCRPPEFSGVIYYDSDGKQISELPRSPRPTSSFPVLPDDDDVYN